ncbi:MAG TPA: hypothetical protein VMW16_15955 [Sedimentisphaerales bacterium]|nr:hypothetical protein [Sedimentisphaerales bacterium]
MDDFEFRLKTIALAKPPGQMKSRIFGDRPGVVFILRRRIAIGWAAVFAIFAGLAGMYISPWVRPAPPAKAVIVQIIRAPSDRNVFDFTEATGEFMPGELAVKVKQPEEI